MDPAASTSGQPGPSSAPADGASNGAPAPKSQKSMTKAERRELQERQRAEKAARDEKGPAPGAKAAGKQPPGASAPKKSGKEATPTKGGAQAGTSKVLRDLKEGAATNDDLARRTHGLRIFSHFGLTKAVSGKGDVHPSITRLALLFSSFKICGANARCLATLAAFKAVIQDYVTPPNSTLSRHLMTYLSPQISHLVMARPMSVTMGNAIRELKVEIGNSDIDLPEQDAKDALCRKIDNYIRDRIVVAGEVIQDTAGRKINDGDVILTFARSSIVERVLLNAHEQGKRFSVVVVDSRPMLEGKRLLSVLTSVDIPCTYLLLPALGSIITEVSMVMVGAHSLHSNGAVFSRAGTALVAMMAKQHSVPVMVCCETYKFAEGIQLDSFTKNELAPVGTFLSTFPTTLSKDSLTLKSELNLEILNPLYDLTPPTSITAVVTEVGIIPPNSISSIPLALGRQSI